MAIERRLYTAEDLWNMGEAGRRFELARGVLIPMPPPGGEHGETATNFTVSMHGPAKRSGAGKVVIETDFVLTPEADVVRRPDVAFIRAERGPLPVQFVPYAPDIAVEVVSPSESPSELAEKIRDYLAAGTRQVWVAYPSTRSVQVHDVNGARTFGPDDILDGGDVLPGFSERVGDLFPA
jgi:Uma2 family endonuclease